MGYFKQKVVLYKRIGNTFDTGEDVTNFYNFQVNKGIAEKQDTFQMNIVNANNRYNTGSIKFMLGDKIRLYMWKNSASPTNNDIVIDGFITKASEIINQRGKVITLTGKNVLEYLFSTPVFLDTSGDGALTSPYIIKKIIDEINSKNKYGNTGFQINYTGPSASGTLSTLNSDGTAISTTHSNLQDYWKKGNLLIEDYSTPEMTGDSVTHLAYVDTDSNGQMYFYWQPRSGTTTDTTLTEGVEPTQIKTSYKSEVVNAVIANCGIDPRNHGITVFVADYASINTHGAKWKYVGRWRNTAEELMTNEEQTNAASFNDSDRFPSSYNYTTAWGTVCTDDGDYKDAIRNQAKALVKEKVKGSLRGTFDPKFIADIELPGMPDYSLGDYIPHTIPSYNISNTNLRLVQSSHSFWNSGITSEEDTPAGIGTY